MADILQTMISNSFLSMTIAYAKKNKFENIY